MSSGNDTTDPSVSGHAPTVDRVPFVPMPAVLPPPAVRVVPPIPAITRPAAAELPPPACASVEPLPQNSSSEFTAPVLSSQGVIPVSALHTESVVLTKDVVFKRSSEDPLAVSVSPGGEGFNLTTENDAHSNSKHLSIAEDSIQGVHDAPLELELELAATPPSPDSLLGNATTLDYFAPEAESPSIPSNSETTGHPDDRERAVLLEAQQSAAVAQTVLDDVLSDVREPAPHVMIEPELPAWSQANDKEPGSVDDWDTMMKESSLPLSDAANSTTKMDYVVQAETVVDDALSLIHSGAQVSLFPDEVQDLFEDHGDDDGALGAFSRATQEAAIADDQGLFELSSPESHDQPLEDQGLFGDEPSSPESRDPPLLSLETPLGPLGSALVGARVSVYWDAEQSTFLGTVTGFDAALNEYEVRYDDGDVQHEFLQDLRVLSLRGSDVMSDPKEEFHAKASEFVDFISSNLSAGLLVVSGITLSPDEEARHVHTQLIAVGNLVRLARAQSAFSSSSDDVVDSTVSSLVALLLERYITPASGIRWNWQTDESDLSIFRLENAFAASAICLDLCAALLEETSDRTSRMSVISIEDVVQMSAILLHDFMRNIDGYLESRDLVTGNQSDLTSPNRSKLSKLDSVPRGCVSLDRSVSELVMILELLFDVIVDSDVNLSDSSVHEVAGCALWPFFVPDLGSFSSFLEGAWLPKVSIAALPILELLFVRYPKHRRWVFEEVTTGICSGILPTKILRLAVRKVDIGNHSTMSPGLEIALDLRRKTDGARSKVLFLTVLVLRCLQSCGGTNYEDIDFDNAPSGASQRASQTVHEAMSLVGGLVGAVFDVTIDRTDRDKRDIADVVKSTFDLLVNDLILLSLRPEWPAAELCLDVISARLLSFVEDSSAASTNARTQAIRWLGSITAELRPVAVRAKQSPLKCVSISAASVTVSSSKPITDPTVEQARVTGSLEDAPLPDSEADLTPSSTTNSSAYCVCRGAIHGFMLSCDRCEEWYHGSCVGILSESALRLLLLGSAASTADLPDWMCPSCQGWLSATAASASILSEHALQEAGINVEFNEATILEWRRKLELRTVVSNYLIQRAAAESRAISESTCILKALQFSHALWRQNDEAVHRKLCSGASGVVLPGTLAAWHEARQLFSVARSHSEREMKSLVSKISLQYPTLLGYYDILQVETLLAVSRPLMKHSGSTFLSSILDVLHGAGDENNGSVAKCRSQAVRALTDICTADPMLLADTQIATAVHARMLDSSATVRNTVLQLVGKQIAKNPDQFLGGKDRQYLGMMLARSRDVGLNVRVQAVSILHDILLANPRQVHAAEIMAHLIILGNNAPKKHDSTDKDRGGEDRLRTRALSVVRAVLFSEEAVSFVGDKGEATALLHLPPKFRASLMLAVSSADISTFRVASDEHMLDEQHGRFDMPALRRDMCSADTDSKFAWFSSFLQESLLLADWRDPIKKMSSAILDCIIDQIASSTAQIASGIAALKSSDSDDFQVSAAISAAEYQANALGLVYCLCKTIPGLILAEKQAHVLFELAPFLGVDDSAPQISVLADALGDNDRGRDCRVMAIASHVRCADTIHVSLSASPSFDNTARPSDDLKRELEQLQVPLKTVLYKGKNQEMVRAAIKCWSAIVRAVTGSQSKPLCEQVFEQFYEQLFLHCTNYVAQEGRKLREGPSSGARLSQSLFAKFPRGANVTPSLAALFDWDSFFSQPSSQSSNLASNFRSSKEATIDTLLASIGKNHQDIRATLEMRKSRETEFCVVETVAVALLDTIDHLTRLIPTPSFVPALFDLVTKCIDGVLVCSEANPQLMLVATQTFGRLLNLDSGAFGDLSILVDNLKTSVLRCLGKFLLVQERQFADVAEVADDTNSKSDADSSMDVAHEAMPEDYTTDISKAVCLSISSAVSDPLISSSPTTRQAAAQLVFVMIKCGVTVSKNWIPLLLALQFENDRFITSRSAGEYASKLLKSMRKTVGETAILSKDAIVRAFHLAARLSARCAIPLTALISTRSPTAMEPALGKLYLSLSERGRLALLQVLVTLLQPVEAASSSDSAGEDLLRLTAESLLTLPFDAEWEALHVVHQISRSLMYHEGLIKASLKDALKDPRKYEAMRVARNSFRLLVLTICKDVIKKHFRLTDAKCAAYNPSSRGAVAAKLLVSPVSWERESVFAQVPSFSQQAAGDVILKQMRAAIKGSRSFAKDFTNVATPAKRKRGRPKKGTPSPKTPAHSEAANSSSAPPRKRARKDDSDDDYSE